MGMYWIGQARHSHASNPDTVHRKRGKRKTKKEERKKTENILKNEAKDADTPENNTNAEQNKTEKKKIKKKKPEPGARRRQTSRGRYPENVTLVQSPCKRCRLRMHALRTRTPQDIQHSNRPCAEYYTATSCLPQNTEHLFITQSHLLLFNAT